MRLLATHLHFAFSFFSSLPPSFPPSGPGHPPAPLSGGQWGTVVQASGGRTRDRLGGPSQREARVQGAAATRRSHGFTHRKRASRVLQGNGRRSVMVGGGGEQGCTNSFFLEEGF